MLRKRRTRATKSFLAAAVLLALHFTQTEASPLKKTARQDSQKELNDAASGFRQGVIVFGKGPKNDSAREDGAYQADFPGWHKGRMFEDQFYQMDPTLMCGPNQLRLRAVGSLAKHFALNQHPPLSLSQVPSTCGYNMHRNPYGLVLNVPYDGCYIVMEHGHFHLPLLWKGIPVTLKCFRPEDSTTVAPTTPSFYPWLTGMPWPLDPTTTTAAPQDPVFPQMPPGQLMYLLYYLNMLYQMSSAPTPTNTPQDPFPQMPLNYWLQWLPWLQHDPAMGLYHYHLFKGFPYPTQPPPTTPPQDPQMPQIPQSFLEWLPQQFQFTTASPQGPVIQFPQNPWHMVHPGHFHLPKGPFTLNEPQIPWYGHKWVFPSTTSSTASTTTASQTTDN